MDRKLEIYIIYIYMYHRTHWPQNQYNNPHLLINTIKSKWCFHLSETKHIDRKKKKMGLQTYEVYIKKIQKHTQSWRTHIACLSERRWWRKLEHRRELKAQRLSSTTHFDVWRRSLAGLWHFQFFSSQSSLSPCPSLDHRHH